jgi:hypothetical protein
MFADKKSCSPCCRSGENFIVCVQKNKISLHHRNWQEEEEEEGRKDKINRTILYTQVWTGEWTSHCLAFAINSLCIKIGDRRIQQESNLWQVGNVSDEM